LQPLLFLVRNADILCISFRTSVPAPFIHCAERSPGSSWPISPIENRPLSP
jgi:hypothetical protein